MRAVIPHADPALVYDIRYWSEPLCTCHLNVTSRLKAQPVRMKMLVVY